MEFLISRIGSNQILYHIVVWRKRLIRPTNIENYSNSNSPFLTRAESVSVIKHVVAELRHLFERKHIVMNFCLLQANHHD